MPTYQYECSACGHELEVLQSMTEKRLKKCPACGKNTLERLIGTGTGIIFKGSGFYETDYKKKSAPQNESKGESSKTASKTASDSAPCSDSCACHPKTSAGKN